MSEIVLLSREDGEFAEFLSQLEMADWAHILFHLSESSKNDLRASVGTLIAQVNEGKEPDG